MMMKNNNPIFVLGGPRSGTTMLRLMITAHKRVCIPPECGFALWLYSAYKDWDSSAGYNSFIADLVRTKKFETWGLAKEDIIRVIKSSNPLNYADLVSCVYEAYAYKMGRSNVQWGDKNNFYLNYISELRSLYPDAYVIFIIRDPRDVFSSYKEVMSRNVKADYAPDLTVDAGEFCNEWNDVVDKVDLSYALFADKLLVVRYEDLVINPESEARKICNHIDIHYDNRMLAFYDINDEPDTFSSWKGNTYRPIASSSVGRYKTCLQKEEIKIIDEKLRGGLLRWSY